MILEVVLRSATTLSTWIPIISGDSLMIRSWLTTGTTGTRRTMPDNFINHGLGDLNGPITSQELSRQPKKNTVLVSHGRPPWYTLFDHASWIIALCWLDCWLGTQKMASAYVTRMLLVLLVSAFWAMTMTLILNYTCNSGGSGSGKVVLAIPPFIFLWC